MGQVRQLETEKNYLPRILKYIHELSMSEGVLIRKKLIYHTAYLSNIISVCKSFSAPW